MNLERLYLKLPVTLQNAVCFVEGWRIGRTRFGKAFQKSLGELEQRTFWTPEQIETFQNKRLATFVEHAARNVPFYRKQFSEIGFDPHSVHNLAHVQEIPILEKATVQDHCSEFLAEDIPASQRVPAHTSGSSGGGLKFCTTRAAAREQWAVWWRFRKWHGLEQGTWCAFFGGRSVVPLSQHRPPYWRYNVPGRQILFSGYHLSPQTMKYYLDELRRRQPPWFHGYPSVLALLAGHVVENGLTLGFPVRWISIGAENLLPQQSQVIQEAFGVLPIQHYGMGEAVANISQCPQNRLHIDEDFAPVELVPNNGGGYRIVGTNVTNPAFPLIRYDVGDIVQYDGDSCECGRPGRVVQSIDGRSEDYVILRNGARLGRMDHIFKDLVAIREAQLYQKRPGEITVRIVRANGYNDSDEQLLLREFQQRIGDQATVTIDYVPHLERTSTGKLRFVVSEIEEGQLVARGSNEKD